jgi:hypothetical protein
MYENNLHFTFATQTVLSFPVTVDITLSSYQDRRGERRSYDHIG